MDNNILTLSSVSKFFGAKRVLQNLNFSVPERTIFGFIGQNGAGKTTTMKLILGLLRCDSGEIYVKEEKVRFGQNRTNRFLGYLPDVPEFYGFMTPMEYLVMCGKIADMPAKDIRTRAGELLELVGLDREHRYIKGFSRGMKQRLGIAQALLHRPALLLCDEPTSALDPAGRKEILETLRAVKEDTTILFSTHILSDVERICDEVAFLHEGKLALQGTIEEIKRVRGDSGAEVEFLSEADCLRFAARFPGGERIGAVKLCYKKNTQTDMSEMMRFLAGQHISIQRLERLEPTLEDLFMEVIRK